MQMMLNPLSLFLSLLPDLSLCECVPTLILSFWTLVSFYPYADGLFSRYFLWNLLQCLTLSRYTLPLENGSRFEWGKSPYSAERKAWPQRAVGLYYVISAMWSQTVHKISGYKSSDIVMCLSLGQNIWSWQHELGRQAPFPEKRLLYLKRWKWDTENTCPTPSYSLIAQEGS